MSEVRRMFEGGVSRRRFLRAAGVAAGAIAFADVLAACSFGGQSNAPKGTVTITYWDWWEGQAPWVDNEIKLFQQAHPGILVQKTTNQFSQYDNLLGLVFRDGKSPDVFMIPLVQVPFNQQIKQGWIKPLKPAGDAWTKRFPQGSFVVGGNVFDGKVYSAPQTGYAPGEQMYFNGDVFKAAGLTKSDGSIQVPKTWDDVTKAADTITKKGNGNVFGVGFGNGTTAVLPWWVDIFVRAAGSPGGTGGGGFSAPGGMAGFDHRTGKFTTSTDRNYEDFIRLMLEWKSKGYFWPNGLSAGDEIARAAFRQGKIGMTVGGVWMQPPWTRDGFSNYTLSALIGPSEAPKGFWYHAPGGFWIAISAQTKHADEAWAWLDWMYSVDAGKRWTQEYNEDTSIFPAANDPSKIKSKPFADYVATTKQSLLQPSPVARNPEVGSVVMRIQAPTFSQLMTGFMSGQLGDIHAALSDYDGRAKAAFDAGIKNAQDAGAKVSADDYVFADWDISKDYQTKPKA